MGICCCAHNAECNTWGSIGLHSLRPCVRRWSCLLAFHPLTARVKGDRNTWESAMLTASLCAVFIKQQPCYRGPSWFLALLNSYDVSYSGTMLFLTHSAGSG